MTITIQDEYLISGIVGVALSAVNTYLLYNLAKKDGNVSKTKLVVFSSLSLFPPIGVVTLCVALCFTYGESVLSTLKYVRNIPKNAKLLEALKLENEQLRHDNLVFQKMVQENIDHGTAESIVNQGGSTNRVVNDNPNIGAVGEFENYEEWATESFRLNLMKSANGKISPISKPVI